MVVRFNESCCNDGSSAAEIDIILNLSSLAGQCRGNV